MCFTGRKGFEKGILRRGSKKGLLRRHLEGRNTPFQEYDPLRVRPTQGGTKAAQHLLGCANPGLFLAKYLAEKTKCIDVSQPPHQVDEPKRRQNGR